MEAVSRRHPKFYYSRESPNIERQPRWCPVVAVTHRLQRRNECASGPGRALIRQTGIID